MRIRSLKPEFFTDRVTGRWPAELALFYQALWVLADDEGRFEWEPEGIRGQLFPYRSLIDPCALMEELRKTGHVIKYSADGAYYGWLPKFKKHQHPNRPQESKLPDPSLSTHVPLTESSVSTHCKRSLVEESSVRDLESSGEECSGEERRDHRSTDHPCVLKLSATRDEAAGAAREGTDPDSSPELSGSEPSPSEAKALTGGPPTKAATTTDDLDPPTCPGPPEILAHEKPPLSSVESGRFDLPAAPPASATGDGGTAPPPPPKPKKTNSEPASPSALDRLIEIWEQVCVPVGFAKAHRTSKQKRAAQIRIREPGWLDAFSEACSYAASEPFYRGGSSSGWVMTFGWLLQPGNAEKTAEKAQTRKANGSNRPLAFEPAYPDSAFTGGERPI
jgi:hypothetical protein